MHLSSMVIHTQIPAAALRLVSLYYLCPLYERKTN